MSSCRSSAKPSPRARSSPGSRTVGDDDREGDKLFEVETDKVTVEVQAIAAGMLTEIRVAAGSVVKVGAVVAVIGDAGGGCRQPNARRRQSDAPASSLSRRLRGKPDIDPFNEVRTPPEHLRPARSRRRSRHAAGAPPDAAARCSISALVAREVKARGETRVRAERCAGGVAISAGIGGCAVATRLHRGCDRSRSCRSTTSASAPASGWPNLAHDSRMCSRPSSIDFGAVEAVRAVAQGPFKSLHRRIADLSAVHRARGVPRAPRVSATSMRASTATAAACRATSISASPSICRTRGLSCRWCAAPSEFTLEGSGQGHSAGRSRRRAAAS